MSSVVIHPFAPVYDERSRILILGSMPSVKSRENAFYYGHPQNRFWRVLAAVYGAPVPITIPEKRALLLENGVALWDVAARCEITGSSDGSIRNPVPNDIAGLLEKCSVRRIFANGKTAESLYRRLIHPAVGREIIPLPSTSPANMSFSLERLVAAWQKLREE